MSENDFSYNDWFSEKLAPDGDVEDGCHPGEAQAMKDFLYQRSTAAQAALAITRPVLAEPQPEEHLHRLWGFIEDSLVELPSKHIESLIELLQAIQDLPGITLANSQRLWKGLGSFGHMWSDGYMNGTWRQEIDKVEPSQRDELQRRHARKAEIEARLVMAAVGGIPIDWGYEVVADVLESSNALLDFDVPAAAKWLVVCGQKFRQGAELQERSWALKSRGNQSPMYPLRDLWKSPSDQVMTLERWAFWEQRLEELVAEPGVVKEAATMALQYYWHCEELSAYSD